MRKAPKKTEENPYILKKDYSVIVPNWVKSLWTRIRIFLWGNKK